ELHVVEQRAQSAVAGRQQQPFFHRLHAKGLVPHLKIQASRIVKNCRIVRKRLEGFLDHLLRLGKTLESLELIERSEQCFLRNGHRESESRRERGKMLVDRCQTTLLVQGESI